MSPPGGAPGAGEREALPRGLAPMLATTGALPVADGWAYELKWDGMRALVALEAGRATAWSRTGRAITAGWPELSRLAVARPAPDLLLDGELVALDAEGRPSFGLLQSRIHLDPAAAEGAARVTPVRYAVFDVLHLDGRSTRRLPWSDRRALLEGLALEGPCWQTPPAFLADGADLLAAAAGRGLEGVVAKRLDSTYRPGERSPAWVKVKHTRSIEALVAGWREGTGGRTATLGSLLLALPAPEGLRYVGHVGSGFSEQTLAQLTRLLRPLERPASPCAQPLPAADRRGAHWVEPVLVGEVAFTSWTADGRLRHPTWRGLRTDKTPADLTPLA